MNNPKNAGMRKMTDKVMRGGSPLAQQMEDDGIRWKNESTANQPKVKYRKDGSVRKVIEGDKVKWDTEFHNPQTITKYRKDGTKKKEVTKTAGSKYGQNYHYNRDSSGKITEFVGHGDYQTTEIDTRVRKYDKEGELKASKWKEHNPKRHSPERKKEIARDVADNIGLGLATVGSAATGLLIAVGGSKSAQNRRKRKWAKANPGKGVNNNPYR